MKRVYFLYNPRSGRETIKGALSDLIEAFCRSGFEVVVRPTLHSGEATGITADLPDGYDALICCGGDGTLNETVTGALRRSSPLTIGYIPCGSTNDFGNTLYGTGDKLQITNRILRQDVHKLDCGRLEDKTFVYAAAFGLFTDISYETPHSAKAALGHIAYLLEAVKDLTDIQVHRVKAELDSGEVIEGSFLIGMVTNAGYVGGIQNLAGKDIDLHDGELELTLIARPEKPADYGMVLQALTEGSQNEFVLRRKIKDVRFTFDVPTSFTADGEYGGTYLSADVRCLPSAFSLWC